MCDVLKVSPSGFYARLGRPESKQAKTRRRLTVLIEAVHKESRETYGSPRVHAELKSRGETCCMSRKGNCWDNAVMESFYRSIKAELIYHEDFQSREDARRAIFEYIEVFYNGSSD